MSLTERLRGIAKVVALVGVISTSYNARAEEPKKDECNVSFGGYTGMCRDKTFGGSTVLVKELSDGNFIFYRDDNNDGCFDAYGRGFYMMGLAQRTEDNPFPKGEYCLDKSKNKVVKKKVIRRNKK